MPTADDLFRPTGDSQAPSARGKKGVTAEVTRAVAAVPDPVDSDDSSVGKPLESPELAASAVRTSGRVRHDEKMTVYVTADELLDIEHSRLSLRRHHGLAIDRGRLVREAIAIALADIELNGEDSEIVQRLIAQ